MQSRTDRILKKDKVNIIVNFDDLTRGNKQGHNPHWRQIPDHPYKVLVGGSGSGQINTLVVNLINITNHQPDIDKNVLCATDSYKSKYQYLAKNVKKLAKNIGKTLWRFFCSWLVVVVVVVSPHREFLIHCFLTSPFTLLLGIIKFTLTSI